MIEQICDYIHNYFIKEVYRGTFTIENGSLSVDFLQEGQYFKIIGSIFNDGVFQHSNDTLTDESFEGEVWAMAVPPAVIAIATEAEEWENEYGDKVNSPFQSESFGGYSYSKASGNGGNNGGTASYSWKDVFGSRLNHWRKIR